jgi:hypothetical protein
VAGVTSFRRGFVIDVPLSLNARVKVARAQRGLKMADVL